MPRLIAPADTILIFSILMVPAVFVGGIRNATGCIALISITAFGYSGALANLLAVPGDVFPKEAVASIWGFASMGAGFGGMIFSLITRLARGAILLQAGLCALRNHPSDKPWLCIYLLGTDFSYAPARG